VSRKPINRSKRSSRTSLVPCLLLCLSLAGSSFARDGWVVREDGMGPVKIGMTLAQLRAALHQKLGKEESVDEDCFYVPAPGSKDVSFMIIDHSVVRIDVRAPGIMTSTGIQLGDSEARARQVYGDRMKVTAHTYNDNGHYLTVLSVDGHYGIRFETDNGKIGMFYAGKYDAIQYVEGCE
jgi:hypothetical protein